MQKGTSEEKTNTTKKKCGYDCVHTDSDSYRPSNLLRSYEGLSTKTKDGRITGSSPTQTIRCARGGKSHITVSHCLFCTNTIPPALHFSTFLILLLYPSLTLSFYRYSSVSRCDVHEVDKECRTYSGGPFALSRARRLLLGRICRH